MKRKNEDFIKEKKMIIILVIIFIFLLIITLILSKVQKKDDKIEEYKQIVAERIETEKQLVVEDLSKKTEQERMEFYCAQFFKYVSNRDFESAYDLLYDEYKDNYFPTIESFKKYMIEYFPSTMSITYENMERLGNLYVLWINVKDVYNPSGNNFDMNVVIKEDAYNDIEMSFSRNSAVDGMEE